MFAISKKKFYFLNKKIIFIFFVLFFFVLNIQTTSAEEVNGVIHGPGGSAGGFVAVTQAQITENGGIEDRYYTMVAAPHDSSVFERQEYIKFKNGKIGFGGWPDTINLDNGLGYISEKQVYWQKMQDGRYKLYAYDNVTQETKNYVATTNEAGQITELYEYDDMGLTETTYTFDAQNNFQKASSKNETPNGYKNATPFQKKVYEAVGLGGKINNDDGVCFKFHWGFVLSISNCVEQLMYLILVAVAWILGLVVWLFNTVFIFTVVFMADSINGITAIGAVWKVFRDLTNILLIFILIYLAISTILGINEHGIKHTLSKLILIAILINFSMFFAKVVVDSANILAISFYKQIQREGGPSNIATLFADTYKGPSEEGGVAGAFMASFQFTKLFNDYDKVNLADGVEKNALESFARQDNAMTIFFMGSIAMFFVIIIFIAATLIFIKRLVTIMILIMVSSLAFASSLLHKTETYAHQWWEKLIAEAFYAPIFVAIIWMALHIMTDEGFRKTLATDSSGIWFSIPVIVNYIIVINLFIIALVAGEKIGASGAGAAMGAYKWMKGNIGGRAIQAGIRNTIGRAAYGFYEGKDKNGVQHGIRGKFKTWMETTRGKGKFSGAFADTLKNVLRAGVEAKVGPGNNFKEEFSEKQHAMAEALFEMQGDPAAQAAFLAEMTVKAKKNLNVRVALENTIKGMSIDEQAEMIEQFEEKIKNTTDEKEKKRFEDGKNKFLSRLNPNQQDALARKREGALAIHREKYNKLQKEIAKSDEYKNINENEETLTLADGTQAKVKGLAGKRKKLEELIENKKKRGEDVTALETTLQDTKDKIAQNEEALRKNGHSVELRRFFSKLNTKQQEGLSREQLLNPAVSDLIQGNLFEQLQRSGKLNNSDYDRLGKRMDEQINRLDLYTKAAGGDDVSRTKLLEEVNKHLKSLGEEEISNADYILEHYENNLLTRDTATGMVGPNMARYYGTERGDGGKNTAQNALKAKQQRRAGNPTPATPAVPNPLGSSGPIIVNPPTPPTP